ncbi:MAG: AraC family transcriptional regulator [Steroidobacteraceae bacterium]
MLRPLRVRHYLGVMQELGFDPGTILKGTQVDEGRLADPSYLVSAEQCHAVVGNMVRLTGNRGIGLDVGRMTHLTDLGIVGYAIAASSTLEQAIHLWMRFGKTSLGFPFLMKRIEHSSSLGQWGMSAATTGLEHSTFRFYVEETIALGVGLGPLLTGWPMRYEELHFSYSAPSYVARYEATFDCPLHFESPHTYAVVKSPSLDTPVKSSDSELRELCIRHCDSLAQRDQLSGPIKSRLREALKARGSIPTFEQAAQAMNLSTRSLARYLQQEGTSFQVVLDEFRCDLAKEYLGAGIWTKEVAYLLGFSHVDSFRQAFKAWTGATVGAYQASIGRERSSPRRHSG